VDGSRAAQARATTPSIRLLLVAASLLVFWAGVPLFLGSEQTERYFSWTVQPPLTAAFLGAMYWSSLVLVALALRRSAWAEVRIAVFSILVVTTLILVATLLHLDRFHLASPRLLARLGTWVWLAVYVGIPPIAALLVLDQLRRPGQDGGRAAELPRWVVFAYWLLAVVLVPAGLALFVAPLAVAAVWPWKLTALTAQVTGSWVVGLGLNAGLVAWEDDHARTGPALLSSIVLVGLQVIALVRYPADVNWASPGSWLYLLVLLGLMLAGVAAVLAAPRAGLADRNKRAD
jgi:hypothetical protein